MMLEKSMLWYIFISYCVLVSGFMNQSSHNSGSLMKQEFKSAGVINCTSPVKI
jgi:hypothetical protein